MHINQTGKVSFQNCSFARKKNLECRYQSIIRPDILLRSAFSENRSVNNNPFLPSLEERKKKEFSGQDNNKRGRCKTTGICLSFIFSMSRTHDFWRTHFFRTHILRSVAHVMPSGFTFGPNNLA